MLGTGVGHAVCIRILLQPCCIRTMYRQTQTVLQCRQLKDQPKCPATPTTHTTVFKTNASACVTEVSNQAFLLWPDGALHLPNVYAVTVFRTSDLLTNFVPDLQAVHAVVDATTMPSAAQWYIESLEQEVSDSISIVPKSFSKSLPDKLRVASPRDQALAGTFSKCC